MKRFFVISSVKPPVSAVTLGAELCKEFKQGVSLAPNCQPGRYVLAISEDFEQEIIDAIKNFLVTRIKTYSPDAVVNFERVIE